MRTENDSWDIKTGVGTTALFVAAARGLAARRPEPMAIDRIAELFCRAAGGEWEALFDSADECGNVLSSADFGTSFQDYQAGRTRYFDDFVQAALDAGVRQVVILAAGLDSRAYRLPWPDDAAVYELDRPQVLEFKAEVLAEHCIQPRARRHELAVDLREDWASALCAEGFDSARPSAWIVEGLLVYLSPDEQNRLFDAIDRLAAPGSSVALEQMETMDPSRHVAATDRNAARHVMAEYSGLIYHGPRSDAAQWFDRRGWSADRTEMIDYLFSLGWPGPSGSGFVPSLMNLVTAHRPVP
ncbi:class I SAM-dependent methyltransferase [Nocardia sp. NPDC050793]|uniref:class I SAM-dependent methyltransferase n=1 Tax=Nocardia sp. NPDC050793 TaxID=3155159 RepID=UPI0033CA195E